MADHIFLIRKTDRPRNKTGGYDFIDRNKGFETISYTPDETDRGGVNINEAFVYDNRVYSYQYRIDVPWNNKVLKINYASYRNKTEPGSNEKWTVTVQTDKHEKAAAELLTGMYDASLDQFRPQNWTAPNIWESYFSGTVFNGRSNFAEQASWGNNIHENYLQQEYIIYDHLAIGGSELWDRDLARWINDSIVAISGSLKKTLKALKEVELLEDTRIGTFIQKGVRDENITNLGGLNNLAARGSLNAAPQVMVDRKVFFESDIDNVFTSTDIIDPATGNHIVNGKIVGKISAINMNSVQTRKNFNETAFFFPQLYADSSGKYSFSFTMPEALTQWKWMSLAHTKDLAFGSYSTHIVTQKTLMVQPNAPRFMREGDNMEFSGKIVNLSDKELTGQVTLELIDAATNTSVDGWFQNVFPSQYFTVAAGQSSPIKFPIQIPFSFNRPLTWRIVAKAGEFSDGEENTLPILTNRMLVTESLPLFLQSDTTQHFKFEKLLHTTSETLTHEGLTVEYTSNPVWYAVQALQILLLYN